ncbi:MAG: hypothetical protein Q7T86_18025 [Hyphomicrobiaceae bacterium]|nr:hypothetical protein [Hyphomicrobiaceae bacterium]
MTTIDAAAAWGVRKKALLAALITGLGIGLGGCETGASLFGGSSSSASSDGTSIAAQVPAAVAPAKIAVAPVFGPSETIAKSLHGQMVSAIEQQKITVAKNTTDKSEYTLRGYFLSSKKGNKTSISYVWDVTDPTGKRLNRIAGEELVDTASGRDPWTSVTPQVGEKIASKTATNLSTWLPTVAPSTPPPSAVGAPPTSGSAAPNNGNIPMAAVPPAGAAPPQQTATAPLPATPPTATGSIGREGAISAMVPTVTGAPGGGSLELTNAIQRELTKNGVTLTPGGGQAYKVEGKVTVGQITNGKQAIEIEWQVKDPTGKKLGTVSQKNNIVAGSLDGPWGKIADMVAEAAVKRIVELLPSQVRQAKAG